MLLTSQSFPPEGEIPKKFTCDGGDINPQLEIHNVPSSAKSLVLIVDDPDATRGVTFTHWLVWNIDPKTTVIKQESKPPKSVQGLSDFNKPDYGGPCPPAGKKHRYFFRLYALDTMLSLAIGETRINLESAMQNHIIEETELMGFYER